jgi:transcription elongation factor Elf1
MTSRFKDHNLLIYDFIHELHLNCPECKHKLISKNDIQTYVSKLSCTNCGFRTVSDNTTIELSVKANCNNCGEKIRYNEEVNEKKDQISIRCKKCKVIHKFDPKVSEYKSFQPLIDTFGLWYNEDFKGNHFWALNDDHLEYIEEYIKADLRERNRKNRPAASLAEKLPQFIKSAKNREALLKLISKMKIKKI